MRTTAFANAAILMGVAAAQLRLPVSRQPAHASPLHRRTPTADLTGDSLRYSVNVSVGTPSQELSLFLSFDSEKTWVPHPTSCGEFDDCPGGSFEPSDSSSYDDADVGTFSLDYADGSSTIGLEFEDTIKVADAEVTLKMGMAMSGEFTQGELSIGPLALDDNSLLQRLVDQGDVNSASYSFWLDDDGSSGSLLFGAVDTSAFDAPLKRIPTLPDESPHTSFPVKFSVLNYTRSPGGEPESIAPQDDLPLMLIRPVTLFSNLPLWLASKIWDLAGASYDKLSELATVPCSGGTGKGSELILTLGLEGGPTVRVSFDDLVIPLDMAPISTSSEEEMCVFAIQSFDLDGELSDDEAGMWGLGGFLLRHTYMAFDLVNEEVAFAPRLANDETPTGEIVPFPSYGASIPQSEDVDPSGHGRDSFRDDFPPRSIGTTGLALLVVGIFLVFAAFFTLLGFLWYRGHCCWRGRRKPKEDTPAPHSGPVSEKVVYAGTIPGPLPPRPTYQYSPGPPSGQLPPGCGWLPAAAQYTEAFAPAHAQARSSPSGAQPAEPPAGASETDNSVQPSTSRPVSPSPSPPTATSSSSHTPAAGGTVPFTEDELHKRRETGDETVGGRH